MQRDEADGVVTASETSTPAERLALVERLLLALADRLDDEHGVLTAGEANEARQIAALAAEGREDPEPRPADDPLPEWLTSDLTSEIRRLVDPAGLSDQAASRGGGAMSAPSGVDIARWFDREMQSGRFRNRGGAGTYLSDECGLWHLATIDHDDQEFYLLDVSTTLDDVTTCDLLFVTSGVFGFACEWRQKPGPQQWNAESIAWFADLVDEYERQWRQGGAS